MEKKFIIKVVSILLAVGILFESCASSTLIQSYPSGAKVYIDGEPVGTTPYWHTDTKISGSIVNVDLVKDGYKPFYTSFMRAEQVDVGAIIGGFFVWFPFLWTMKYKPTHNYELVPIEQQQQNDSIGVLMPLPPMQQPISPQLPPPLISPKLERMRELKKMLDENLITKDDFEKQKQKILEDK